MLNFKAIEERLLINFTRLVSCYYGSHYPFLKLSLRKHAAWFIPESRLFPNVLSGGKSLARRYNAFMYETRHTINQHLSRERTKIFHM